MLEDVGNWLVGGHGEDLLQPSAADDGRASRKSLSDLEALGQPDDLLIDNQDPHRRLLRVAGAELAQLAHHSI